jgi:outer membrane lipoprotein-sorting protein
MTKRLVASLVLCLGLTALCLAAGTSKEPAEKAAKPAPASPAAEKPAAKDAKAAPTPFHDEPAARALYRQMIRAMRKAKSLSYTSHYTFAAQGSVFIDSIYRAWLKKPNFFRIEAETSPLMLEKLLKFGGKRSGVLVGDGKTLWLYWPNGRNKYRFEDPKEYEKTRMISYMTQPAPPGGHSIGHDMCDLGCMSMPVIDPSTFHGYTDSLQGYLDGVQGLGTEKVGSEECDKIEVSIMKRQRSWYLWLSKRDHLPRRLRQTIRVNHDLEIGEDWSAITVDADIPATMFVWKPPKGWKQWHEPNPDDCLLKAGTKAPDFNLASIDGKRIKLSDFRGQVVWLYLWRAG